MRWQCNVKCCWAVLLKTAVRWVWQVVVCIVAVVVVDNAMAAVAVVQGLLRQCCDRQFGRVYTVWGREWLQSAVAAVT